MTTPPSPPLFKSLLSQPVMINNFLAVQSAILAVSNSGGSGSQHVTFTNTMVNGPQRVSYMFANTGTKTAYIAGSNSAAIAAAVASSSTPTPTTGANSVSTCCAIPAGAILTFDFVGGTDTISAICGGADTTNLEISLGYGQ